MANYMLRLYIPSLLFSCLANFNLLVADVSALEIAITGLSQHTVMLSVNGNLRVIKVGDTSPEGIKVISADSESASLEINGQLQTFTLNSDILVTESVTPTRIPSVILYPNKQGMYTVEGTINGYTVIFLIDTGATQIGISGEMANRMGLDYRNSKIVQSVETASGVAKAYPVTLKQVRIGHITLDNVGAVIVEGRYPTEVLLGMSFLQRVDMRHEPTLMELRPRN